MWISYFPTILFDCAHISHALLMIPRRQALMMEVGSSLELNPSLVDGYFVSTATSLPMERGVATVFCSEFFPRTRSKDILQK